MLKRALQTMRLSRRRDSYFLILLPLVFLVSFAIPIVFAAKVGGLFGVSRFFDAEKELFPSSIVVGSPGRFVRVQNSTELNPAQGKDFFFGGWFQFKRLPAVGETMLLLTKFDASLNSKAGYALGLIRSEKDIKPAVYWRNVRGKGGWYEFSPLDFSDRGWTFFAVTVRGGKLLGLHTAEPDRRGKIRLKLSGGFELAEEVFPENSVSLVLGSNTATGFQGRIGPFGIISSESQDAETWLDALTQIAGRPDRLPSMFSKNDLLLWTLGSKIDSSPAAHEIQPVGGKAKKKSGEEETADASEVVEQ